jgi:putative glutamine amidotransferase
MTFAPFVLITSTTETLRDLPRVLVNEAYTDAIAAAGLIPVVLPPVSPAVAVAAIEDIAGLVLTGGEDVDPRHFGQAPHPANGAPHPARDASELALARRALDQRIPTLAICRGAQIMNVALGGTLVQDIPSQHKGAINHDPRKRTERVHRVSVDPASRLARVLGATSIVTNSSHHQSIDAVASGLRIVARSEDGIIEGVEATDDDWWMMGVQWHPEELTDTPEDWDRRLFAAFADAVREAGRD